MPHCVQWLLVSSQCTYFTIICLSYVHHCFLCLSMISAWSENHAASSKLDIAHVRPNAFKVINEFKLWLFGELDSGVCIKYSVLQIISSTKYSKTYQQELELLFTVGSLMLSAFLLLCFLWHLYELCFSISLCFVMLWNKKLPTSRISVCWLRFVIWLRFVVSIGSVDLCYATLLR